MSSDVFNIDGMSTHPTTHPPNQTHTHTNTHAYTHTHARTNSSWENISPWLASHMMFGYKESETLISGHISGRLRMKRNPLMEIY